MRRTLLMLAAGLVLAAPSFGQDPAPPVPPSPRPLLIGGPTTVEAYRLVRLTLDGGPVEDAEWDVLYGGDISLAVDGEELDAAGTRYVFTGPPGPYRVTAWATLGGKMAKASATVTIAGTEPEPPQPPDPPDVDPGPDPEPPATGEIERVLFVFESSANLTREQLATLNSIDLRAYLTTATVKDTLANGYQQPAWRFWDPDVDTSNETPAWQDAWAKVKGDLGGLPKVFVFTDRGVTSFPLPATDDAVIAKLKTFEAP